jgi:hypothetical protein
MNRLEKLLGEEATTRHAYSHPQLVRMMDYRWRHSGQSPKSWDEVVGPPEAALGPGQLSHLELIAETLAWSRTKAPAPPLPGNPLLTTTTEAEGG